MARFSYCSFLLFISLAVSASAQVSSFQNPSETLQIALRSAAVLGLSGRSVAVPISAIGQIHSADQASDGSFSLDILGPRTFRTTIIRDNASYTYVVNNDDGYVLYRGKKQYLASDHVFGERCPYFPIYSFLGELNALDLRLSTIAPVSQHHSSYLLRATYIALDSRGLVSPPTEIEIDAQTFLPSRLRTHIRSDTHPEIVTTVEYSYSDYRQEGSFLLPHQIEVRAQGKLQSTITIQSIQVNSTISAADFRVR